MGDEMRFWGPMVALIAGALAGLGLLRSRQSAFGLAVGLAVIQIIGWVTLSLILWREPGEDWNITLWASFLLALMYVIPYTAIGAAIVGGIIALVRGRGKRKTVCVCVCVYMCVAAHESSSGSRLHIVHVRSDPEKLELGRVPWLTVLR
jgi:hypothetical protein